MTETETVKDLSGKEISIEEFRKLLRQNSHPQYGWWRQSSRRKVGDGKPPPGVRIGKEISKL